MSKRLLVSLNFCRSLKMFKLVFVLSVTSLVWYYSVLNLYLSLLLLFGVYLISGGWRTVRMVYYTLPRDFIGVMKLLRVKLHMARLRRYKLTVPQVFQQLVNKHPNKTMFICGERSYSYADVESYSNQLATYFQLKGFRYGDVVDLMMESRPEFVIVWLGLSKIGCITALINTNLRNQSLVHCIKAAHPKAVIVGTEFVEAVNLIRNELSDDYTYYFCGPPLPEDQKTTFFTYLDEEMSKCQTLAPVVPSNAKPSDSLLYIFTSGTTGLPKAAVITHFRFCFMAWGVASAFGISSKRGDIVYACLPLYHTSGGILGVGQALLNGCTVVIRRKFSASNYWSDCVKYNCTVGQYIGEICRYLLAQPESQHDRQHKVRLMIGNGLRPHIWKEFVERFGIGQIGEFYGATEGNCSVMNTNNKVGAVGFMTQIAPFFYPIMLIKVHPDTGEILRDSNGLCIQCGPFETGHLVGKIIKSDPGRQFDGYLDSNASKKKIVRDVVQIGDSAFLSGDLLERDELGYLYFKDRTGDTFRWKGENVSTTEVEAVLMPHFNNIADVVVYGVAVMGFEGTAGMAAIAISHVPNEKQLKALYFDLRASLPSYALPILLRIISSQHDYKTGTFKLKKFDLQKEGYNPESIEDPLFIIDNENKTYKPFNRHLFSCLNDGTLRL